MLWLDSPNPQKSRLASGPPERPSFGNRVSAGFVGADGVLLREGSHVCFLWGPYEEGRDADSDVRVKSGECPVKTKVGVKLL